MILILTYIGAIILISKIIFIVAYLLDLFPERKIVGVAIKNENLWISSGSIYDLRQFMIKKGYKGTTFGENGFVLDNGTFISREKGFKLMRKNGQHEN